MRLFLVCFFCVLLACTPFVSTAGLANGLVMGKVFWFHLILWLGYIVLFVSFFKQKFFRWNWSDGGLIVYFLSVLFTYSWNLNPEPEKLSFAVQLIGLWFVMRQIFTLYPQMNLFCILLAITCGLAEALLGIAQLHGYSPSNHFFFNLTGTFYNPGPYSGYIAVLLPFCFALTHHRIILLRYYGWVCAIAFLLVLPAGMSRTAWIAAFSGIAFLFLQRYGHQFRQVWKKRYRLLLVGGIVIILAGGAMGYSLYQFKKNSADGRFLMWRITTGIIVRHPLNGTGLGGFPSAYAQSQAEYLTGATQQEKTIAGCPEYAFNEFLQIAAEQGIPSLLIFLFWMGNIAYSAKRKRLYPILAFLLALSLFACASYPLQLPEFWILLVVFGAMAVTSKEEIMEKQSSIRQITTIAILSVFLVAGISTSVQQRKYYVAYQAWNRLKSLYQNQAYEAAEEEYRKWMPMLNHKPEFLFEAAQCYAKTGNRPGAIRLLRRAEKLSSDPMIHYVLAKNEQALGFFPEAEQTLLYAIRILPERLYPYYLLMLLYAEPDFYQPEKIYAAADSLLFKIPKTDSPAVREMQRKAKALRAK